MWPESVSNWEYGSFGKLTAGTYTYTIRFYTGDAVADNGKSYSVKEIKDTDGTAIGLKEESTTTVFKLDDTKVTMDEYADAVISQVAQYNALLSGYGITFTPGTPKYTKYTGKYDDNGNLTTNDPFSVFSKESNKGDIIFVNPNAYTGAVGMTPGQNGGSYFRVISGLLAWSTIVNGGTADSSPGTIDWKNKYYNIREVILHEIAHNLGLTHQWYFNDGVNGRKSGIRVNNIYFGNPNLKSKPFHKGFIHKGWITEDTLNGLDIIYNQTPTAKISGTLTAARSNTLNTNVVNAFKDKYGFAYLIDGTTKEYMYQSPIDKNGYYEFRLRVLPPSSVDYYLLLVSGEFCYHFVNKIWQPAFEEWLTVKRPGYRDLSTGNFNYGLEDDGDKRWLKNEGFIYYAMSKIGAITAGNQTKNISLSTESIPYDESSYKVETLDELKEKINAFTNYGEGETNDYDVVNGSNGKYYAARYDHTSKNNNKPITGDKYKKYWEKTKKEKDKSRAVNWSKDENYKGKYKSQDVLSTIEQLIATVG